MNIQEQLEVELSRWNTDLVSEYVGADRERFYELWNLLLPEKYPVSPRAAWVLEFLCEKKPHLLKPYLDESLNCKIYPDSCPSVRRTETVRPCQFTSF